MIAFLHRFFGQPLVSFLLSGALLAVAGTLVFVHAVTIRQVKEVGLPAALELPQMEQRLTVLRDQVEAAELQEALRTGSAQEQLNVYTVPAQIDLQRLLAFFDLVQDDLRAERLLYSMSPIQIGEELPANAQGLRATPITFEADVNQEGMDKLLLLLRLSGLLTVSDALTPSELSLLVNLTEQENAAALTVIEQFLSVDLLRYAAEPEAIEKQVLRSLPSPEFEAGFQGLIAKSALAKARYLFGGSLGQLLSGHQLWPLPFLSVQHIEAQPLAGGRFHLALTVHAYARGEQ